MCRLAISYRLSRKQLLRAFIDVLTGTTTPTAPLPTPAAPVSVTDPTASNRDLHTLVNAFNAWFQAGAADRSCGAPPVVSLCVCVFV